MTEFEIVSPVDGRVLARRPYSADTEVELVLSAARSAQVGWAARPLAERQRFVHAFITEIGKRKDEFAQQVAWSIGRPIAQADEAEAWTWAGARLVDLASAALADRSIEVGDGAKRLVERRPFGVMLAICPWNYPLATGMPLIVPPLVAGNTVILKHAPQCALTAQSLAEAARAADLPTGVFQVIDMTHGQAERVIGSDDIDIVGFIGSELGGRQVFGAAKGFFKPFLLELGGKDPVYVRGDVDVARVAVQVAAGAFANAGQVCCSVERIYVDRRIAAEFTEALAAEAAKIRMDHSVTGQADMGTLVSVAAAERVRAQVAAAVADGARVMHDGDRGLNHLPTRAYMGPVVLDRVTHEMDIMREETFGPVAPVMAVESDEAAIALMNDSRYGLTAAIWTQDLERGIALGHKVVTGNFAVNQCNYPDPWLPWGGVKASGMGSTDGDLAYEGVTRLRSVYARAF